MSSSSSSTILEKLGKVGLGGAQKLAGSNHPYRGCKFNWFEGGIKVPAFIYGPGVVPETREGATGPTRSRNAHRALRTSGPAHARAERQPGAAVHDATQYTVPSTV